MKIVNVVRVYATHGRPGGMIHAATERCEQLARMGHEVHVLTSSRMEGPHKTDWEWNGVHVHHCPGGEPQQYSDRFTQHCEEETSQLRPDIVHLDSYDKDRLWWHAFAGKCRVAVTNHGEAIGSQLTDWRMNIHNKKPNGYNGIDTAEWFQERDALKPTDAVIATCRFDHWLLSDLLGLGGKVRLVYNPLAPYHFEDRKGVPLLPPDQLDEAEMILKSRRRFVICGLWGKEERGFDLARAVCKEVGAELIEPHCSRRDLVKEYDRSHALLLPGFQSKGYDLSVAEAIARQRPVIMADCGIVGWEEIDQPWIKTFPPGDLAALVKLMKGALPAVPPTAADHWRPEVHAAHWLKAVMGE
jgi:hypothetical protein